MRARPGGHRETHTDEDSRKLKLRKKGQFT